MRSGLRADVRPLCCCIYRHASLSRNYSHTPEVQPAPKSTRFLSLACGAMLCLYTQALISYWFHASSLPARSRLISSSTASTPKPHLQSANDSVRTRTSRCGRVIGLSERTRECAEMPLESTRAARPFDSVSSRRSCRCRNCRRRIIRSVRTSSISSCTGWKMEGMKQRGTASSCLWIEQEAFAQVLV